MRVDIFAIGFGKRICGWNKTSGFSFGNLPKNWESQGNTDYRLCIFPLGGYVKVAGMIDESMDTKFVESEPKPWEFRSKPTYQKLFVITAGVFMNLTLTLLIFWGINFFKGKQVFNTTFVSKVEKESYAGKAGFQSYDKILSINGIIVNDWDDIVQNLLIQSNPSTKVLVERDGTQFELNVSHKLIAEGSQQGFFLFPYPTKPYIQEVLNDSPAEDAGIKAGDIFLSLNGILLKDRAEVVQIISSNKEKEIKLVYLRDEDTLVTTVNPGIEGKIGITITDIYTGEIEFKKYGFFTALTQSISNIGQYTVLTFAMLKNVITGKLAFNQAFGGPVKIAQFAARSADTGATSFLFFLAMLSLSLAIINILPFPALDGGHTIIILLEGILRRELPLKVKIAIQNAGFVLLLALMAFIIYSDIISL
jgi:regulator of sigma E protease